MKLLGKVLNFWRRLRRRRRIARIVQVETMSEVPRRLGGDLYIVVGAKPKWAVLECPCRCGDRIDVNLMESRQPCWRITVNRETISLHPSLWMPQDKCRSHFWVRQNRIDWVE